MKFCLPTIATTLLMAAATPQAAATPITYTLLNASANYGLVGTVNFSGSFTFDLSLPAPLVSVMITATGTGLSPPFTQSPETFDAPSHFPSAATFIDAVSSVTSDDLLMGFANTLTNAPDPIANVHILNSSGGNQAFSVTGEAVPVSAPEPTSLALLSGALGLFLLRTRTNRRDRRPTTRQPEAA